MANPLTMYGGIDQQAEDILQSLLNQPLAPDPMDIARRQRLAAMQQQADSTAGQYGAMANSRQGLRGNPDLIARVENALNGGLRRPNPLSQVPQQPVATQMSNGQTGFAQGMTSNGRPGGVFVQAPLAGPGQAGLDRVAESQRTGRQAGFYAPTRPRPMVGDYDPEVLQQKKIEQKAARELIAGRIKERQDRAAAFRAEQRNPLSGLPQGTNNPLATTIGLIKIGVPPGIAAGVGAKMAETAAQGGETDQQVANTWATATPEQKEALYQANPRMFGEAYRTWKATDPLQKLPSKYRSYILGPNGQPDPAKVQTILNDPNAPEDVKETLRMIGGYRPPGLFGGGSEQPRPTLPTRLDSNPLTRPFNTGYYGLGGR